MLLNMSVVVNKYVLAGRASLALLEEPSEGLQRYDTWKQERAIVHPMYYRSSKNPAHLIHSPHRSIWCHSDIICSIHKTTRDGRNVRLAASLALICWVSRSCYLFFSLNTQDNGSLPESKQHGKMDQLGENHASKVNLLSIYATMHIEEWQHIKDDAFQKFATWNSFSANKMTFGRPSSWLTHQGDWPFLWV